MNPFRIPPILPAAAALILAACGRPSSPSTVEQPGTPPETCAEADASTPNAEGQTERDATTPGPLELARALRNAGRTDEAVTAYRRHLDQAPADPAARVELAEIILWSGEHAEAARLIRGLDPSSGGPRLLRIQGDLAVIEKRLPDAIALYRRHLEAEPGDDPIRLRLAEVLSWEQRYDESLAEYETLLDRHPGDHPLRRKYGQVLGWAGRYPEAAEHIRRSLP